MAKEKPEAPATLTPPEHAKAHGLEPPDAAGVRSLGGWALHDQVTEAQYAAAVKRWQGGNSHAG